MASDEQAFGPPKEPGVPAASLAGKYVYLRPMGVEDYGYVRAMELGAAHTPRWRFRGAVPSPEQWVQSAWASTLAQFVVLRRGEPRPIGLVMTYRANHQDGHAYVGAETFTPNQPSPHLMFGLALFLEYTFTLWNFHKLYFETSEFNLPQFRSAVGRLLVEEARLKEHIWYAGRRWDQIMLALYRDTWRRESGRVLKAQRPASGRTAIIRLPELS